MQLFKNKTILVILLTLPALWALLRPGYYPSHDGTAHLFATIEMAKMLEIQDQFPVRWAADANYSFGSPIFNFYSPLFYYLAGLFHNFGFGYFFSIKLVAVLGFFLACYGMFFLCREIWGDWGGIIGAASYIYIPYRFVDVYVRGAYPEFLALSFFPWALWGFLKLTDGWRFSFFLLGVVSLSAVILSHNFTGLFFLIFLVVFLIVVKRKELKRTSRSVTLALVLALSLSSFFWLPAFFERSYLKEGALETVNYRDHFITLSQLWSSPWGYGSSLPETQHDGMSFQIGKTQLILSVLVFLLSFTRILSPKRKLVVFMAGTTAFFVFLSHPGAEILWQKISFLRFGQFPWRFLGFTALTTSLLASGVSQIFKKREILIYIILGLLILFTIRMARPSSYLISENETVFDRTSFATSWLIPGFLPRWVGEMPSHTPKTRLLGEGEITEEESSATQYYFRVNSPQKQSARLNIFYFPGWQVWIDDQKAELKVDEGGAMNFEIPQGQHEIKAAFSRTNLRLAADLLSFLTALFLSGWAIWVIYNIYNNRRKFGRSKGMIIRT